jgi:HAD superfamily hydrolase (TIGR01509 family)
MRSSCTTLRRSTSTPDDVPVSDVGDMAVLFDMDGLLVDSEPAWFEVESDVFARLQAPRPWSHADGRRLVGQELTVSAAEMVRLADSDRAAEEVADWFVDGMAERMADGVTWKPGAVRLLGELRTHGIRTGLVSSSYRRLVDVVLAQLPRDTFAVSLAGDEVVRGKPDPEPYLRALALLKCPPARAVVLEDSPAGATAAAAAGCTVVLVPDLAELPAEHGWLEVAGLSEVTLAWLRGLLLGGDRR